MSYESKHDHEKDNSDTQTCITIFKAILSHQYRQHKATGNVSKHPCKTIVFMTNSTVIPVHPLSYQVRQTWTSLTASHESYESIRVTRDILCSYATRTANTHLRQLIT
jgi:hypothetical protein